MTALRNLSVWEKALLHQKEFWEQEKKRIVSPQWISIKKESSSKLFLWASQFIKLKEDSRILQIGAGGEGVINYLPIGIRYAIDPLADYFLKNFAEVMDPKVEYHQGMAEDMPFEDNFFDFIIIRNALDHCDDMDKVLSEIKRCLSNNGLVNISVHIYNNSGFFYKTRVIKDPCHTHVLKKDTAEELIRSYNFKIISDRSEKRLPIPKGLNAPTGFKKYIYPVYWLIISRGIFNVLCSKK